MRNHTDIVRGYQRLFWRIQRISTLRVVSEAWLPFDEIDIRDLRNVLEDAARSELSTYNARRAAYLWRMRDVTADGPRVEFEAGLNPYFTASLWREDEKTKSTAA